MKEFQTITIMKFSTGGKKNKMKEEKYYFDSSCTDFPRTGNIWNKIWLSASSSAYFPSPCYSLLFLLVNVKEETFERFSLETGKHKLLHKRGKIQLYLCKDLQELNNSSAHPSVQLPVPTHSVVLEHQIWWWAAKDEQQQVFDRPLSLTHQKTRSNMWEMKSDKLSGQQIFPLGFLPWKQTQSHSSSSRFQATGYLPFDQRFHLLSGRAFFWHCWQKRESV